eukprot:s4445_g1.t1
MEHLASGVLTGVAVTVNVGILESSLTFPVGRVEERRKVAAVNMPIPGDSSSSSDESEFSSSSPSSGSTDSAVSSLSSEEMNNFDAGKWYQKVDKLVSTLQSKSEWETIAALRDGYSFKDSERAADLVHVEALADLNDEELRIYEQTKEKLETQASRVEEEEDNFEATAEDIEREMAEEINAQAEKSKFKTPAWVNITAAVVGDDYFANPRPEIYTFVASMSFEVGVASLIVLNCIILGWQVSLPNGSDQEPWSGFALNSSSPGVLGNTDYRYLHQCLLDLFFEWAEHVFVGLFLCEWSLRVIAFGWVWIFEFSNMADTIMVFIFGISKAESVIPKWVLAPLGIDAAFIRIFTVLRALRLARLARAVRLRPAFKELWILIHGLTTSFRPLAWTLLIAMPLVSSSL